MTLRLCNNRNSPIILTITVVMIVPCTHKTLLSIYHCVVHYPVPIYSYSKYKVIYKIPISVPCFSIKGNIFTVIQYISLQFTPTYHDTEKSLA